MGTVASTLITTCLDNLSKASASTSRSGVASSTLAITWLNNAMKAMARKHDFKELVHTYSGATIASQKTYTLPTNTKVIYDLRVVDGTNSRKLVNVIQNHFDKVIPYPETETTGRPIWYVEFGEHFDVYPIPDIAYTMHIRVQLLPTVVTATTDTVSYSVDKDDVIVAYMCKEGFQHYQMYEDATFWANDYAIKLKGAIEIDDALPDFTPVGRGFDSRVASVSIGEPWNSPFVWRSL